MKSWPRWHNDPSMGRIARSASLLGGPRFHPASSSAPGSSPTIFPTSSVMRAARPAGRIPLDAVPIPMTRGVGRLGSGRLSMNHVL
jgi:hypothetical protein